MTFIKRARALDWEQMIKWQVECRKNNLPEIWRQEKGAALGLEKLHLVVVLSAVAEVISSVIQCFKILICLKGKMLDFSYPLFHCPKCYASQVWTKPVRSCKFYPGLPTGVAGA